jgi:hypothetical protein
LRGQEHGEGAVFLDVDAADGIHQDGYSARAHIVESASVEAWGVKAASIAVATVRPAPRGTFANASHLEYIRARYLGVIPEGE